MLEGDNEETLVGFDVLTKNNYSWTAPIAQTAISAMLFRPKPVAPLKLGSQPLRLHVFVDRSSVEIFAQSGVPGDRYGRRDSLRGMAVLYVISAVGCAFAWNWTSLVVSRFIGGIGIGGSSVLGPMYIQRSLQRGGAGA